MDGGHFLSEMFMVWAVHAPTRGILVMEDGILMISMGLVYAGLARFINL